MASFDDQHLSPENTQVVAETPRVVRMGQPGSRPTGRRVRPQPWGRLNAMDAGLGHVVLQGNYSLKDKNDVCENGFFIGRARACHLCLRDIKVSGKHARIFRTRADVNSQAVEYSSIPLSGEHSFSNFSSPAESSRRAAGMDRPIPFTVFVQDLSTNGTFVNGEKLGKGNTRILTNGDTISIAAKPEDDKNCQAFYTFQDMTVSSHDDNTLEGPVAEKYILSRGPCDVLGTGNFSVVRRGIEIRTGLQRAIKIIDMRKYYQQNSNKDRNDREVDILRAVTHPNIVRIFDVFRSPRYTYLILELATGGELLQSVMEHGSYSEDDARNVFKQILSAVAYLHSKDIVHRDLKPENILLAEPLVPRRDTSEHGGLFAHVTVKVTDFGLATIVGRAEMMKTLCGTPQYVAPEIVDQTAVNRPSQREGYDCAVDMWSLGVLLYVLLSGYPPFNEDQETPLYFQISQGKYDFPDDIWHDVHDSAKDLIRGLMCVDPAARLTAGQALQHAWVVGPRTFFAAPESTPHRRAVGARKLPVATTESPTTDERRSPALLPAAQNLRQSEGRGASCGPMSPIKIPSALERCNTESDLLNEQGDAAAVADRAQGMARPLKRRRTATASSNTASAASVADESDDGAATEAATDTERALKRLF